MKNSGELYAELEALRVSYIHLGGKLRRGVRDMKRGPHAKRITIKTLSGLVEIPVERVEKEYSDGTSMSWFLEKIPAAGELVFTPALKAVEGNLVPVLVYYWRM